jgi:hypothetical protein
VTLASSLVYDLERIKLNSEVVVLVKAMAAVKLMAAGRGLSSDAELVQLATQVSDAYMPAIMSRFWSELDAHTKREVAKARAAGPIGRVDVHLYPEKVEDYLLEHLDMAATGDTVAVTFDGEPLRPVQLAKANGPAPSVQVDVHIPPAQIEVQNAGDVHVPQQAAPVVNVRPAVTVQQQPAGRTEIEYETGPDGKQRPKAITRQ